MKYSVITMSLLAGYLSLLPVHVTADDDKPTARTVLKVCADPNYQPFSSKDQSGYENRIAELIGESMGLPVEYTWFPQRMGFIRNTLRKELPGGEGHLCDLVMGVPKEFELAVPSKPYLSSTYSLVVSEAGKLGELKAANALPFLNETLQGDFKIGITERSPGSVWLAKYAMHEQMAPYIAQSGDPNEFPGQPMLDDMLAGKIDGAIVWGPTAAHFVKQGKSKLRLIPMRNERGVQLEFDISTAVRFGEDEWEEQVNKVLEENAPKIQAIMEEFGIPVVNQEG